MVKYTQTRQAPWREESLNALRKSKFHIPHFHHHSFSLLTFCRLRRFLLKKTMFSQFQLRSQYAETFMGSSMTSLNFSTKEVTFLKLLTFSWVTLLIEDTTQSKHSNFSWLTKFDTPEELLFLEEIMKVDKSHQSMASTMKSSENTETLILGSTALRFSTT